MGVSIRLCPRDNGVATDALGRVSPFRDTANIDFEGQFNALGTWSMASDPSDGDVWRVIEYLTHKNDTAGNESLLGYFLPSRRLHHRRVRRCLQYVGGRLHRSLYHWNGQSECVSGADSGSPVFVWNGTGGFSRAGSPPTESGSVRSAAPASPVAVCGREVFVSQMGRNPVVPGAVPVHFL